MIHNKKFICYKIGCKNSDLYLTCNTISCILDEMQYFHINSLDIKTI
ncbi:hypothetical protein FCR2A7T_27290 [Flavobacterium cauense R2A-7]|nr:hypothetical protein FCR2A7T_27290 [Flavobacterium cauense R2A-7]